MRALIKWILVPGLVVAVGYFLVAPRYGKGVARRVQARVPEVGHLLTPKQPEVDPNAEVLPGDAVETTEASPKGFAPPKVDVSVRDAQPTITPSSEPERRRPRRRPRSESTQNTRPSNERSTTKRSEPKPEPFPETVPPIDPGT